MTGTLRPSTYALNALLRANVPSALNRVFPPGLRIPTASYPRVHITQFTPAEQIASLGASVQSFSELRFKVEVYSKLPAEVEKVADEVLQAIKTNRNYVPSTSTPTDDGRGDLNATFNPNGYFLQLRITGGTDVLFLQDAQLYRRTIDVAGRWFQSA